MRITLYRDNGGDGTETKSVKRGAEEEKQEGNWRRQLQCVTHEYRALTPGLEKELFWVGQAHDTAESEEVKKKFAQYVGVNFKHGASDAQRAVDNLEVPDLHEPADLPETHCRLS